MKKKLQILFVSMLIITIFLVGCGSNENTQQENTKEGNTESQIEVTDDIKMQAEKEGVSVSEMQNTLDGLIVLGAKKYGVSEEEYIKQIEANGNTVLSEWQTASEYMGISITELYEYERTNVASMTDEELETMSGMSEALKMAEDEMEDMPSIGETTVGNMMGIEENDTGEIRTVNMTDEEIKEAFDFEVYKVTQDFTDEYSIVFDYTSDGDIEDLADHYDQILYHTEGYMKIQTPGVDYVSIQGEISGIDVYIEIDNSQGGMPTVSTYIDLTSK